MSTLSHHAQPVVRSRIALIVLATTTALVIAIVLIASHNTTADPFRAPAQPSTTQTPQQQVQAYSGPRYGIDQGIARPGSPQDPTPAVVRPDYHVKVQALAR